MVFDHVSVQVEMLETRHFELELRPSTSNDKYGAVVTEDPRNDDNQDRKDQSG